MYIRMTQYCDKVAILKSVSVAVEAFDAEGNPLKGLRKSTTVQVAVFEHNEPISHPDITEDKALAFEGWRATQLVRIEKAFIENAASGKLGGYPLVKAKNNFGNPAYKIGEFSGVISTMIEVQPGMIKNVMNCKEPVEIPKTKTLAEECSSESICAKFFEITEKFMRRIHLSEKKGCDLYSLKEVVDMRAAHALFSKASDAKSMSYSKVSGNVAFELDDGSVFLRNPSEEAEVLYAQMLDALRN